jgi:hypothetical protein
MEQQAMAVQLTATLEGGRVVIDGDKGRTRLPHKAPATTFQFHLNDTTGMNVRFSSLSAQEIEDCPADGVFETSQIIDIGIGDRNASFKDVNKGDPCVLAYSWFFTCDDPEQRPAFDPIIENGGGNN